MLFLIHFRFRNRIGLNWFHEKIFIKLQFLRARNRNAKSFLTSFTSDRGPTFSRSSVGHLRNKFTFLICWKSYVVYNWDTSLNWERKWQKEFSNDSIFWHMTRTATKEGLLFLTKAENWAEMSSKMWQVQSFRYNGQGGMFLWKYNVTNLGFLNHLI